MMETPCDSTVRARQIAEHLIAMRAGDPAAEVQPAEVQPAGVQPAPPAGVQPAPPVIDYLRLQHHVHWFDHLLRLYRAVARAVAEQVAVPGPTDATAAIDEADRLIDIVHRAHRILLEHPVAAKIAYTALASQGRAFAATPEGAELHARLVGSRRLRRASLVWRSLTMGMLDDQEPGELPATYLDNLLRAIDRADLEQLLGKLQLRRGTP